MHNGSSPEMGSTEDTEATEGGSEGGSRPLEVERTADFVIRTFWSLLKRVGLDEGLTGVVFSTVEWRIRDLLSIDAQGKPREP